MTVWKEIEAELETDDGDVGTTNAEGGLAEDLESEALHRLTRLGPLFNVHVGLSPW
jgi:hypothetical protein